MKIIHATAGLLLFTAAKGQVKEQPAFRPAGRFNDRFGITIQPVHEALPVKIFIEPGVSGSNVALLPDHDKVYILPADRMPCVVPGELVFTMPNGAVVNKYLPGLKRSSGSAGQIPNPGFQDKPLISPVR